MEANLVVDIVDSLAWSRRRNSAPLGEHGQNQGPVFSGQPRGCHLKPCCLSGGFDMRCLIPNVAGGKRRVDGDEVEVTVQEPSGGRRRRR